MQEKLRRIKAILFDKDGTLIDFEQTWTPVTFALALRAAGNDEHKARTLLEAGGYDFNRKRFIGDSVLAAGSVSSIVKLWHPDLDEQSHADEVRYYRAYCSEKAKEKVIPVAGMEQSLRKLKRLGLKTGIGTNDSRDGALTAMDILGCSDLFDVYLGYDSVKQPKPAGDQIVAFAQATQLDVDEIAMVGDNGLDMLAARNGGAGLAIAVLSGNGEQRQLEANSDMILTSIAELPELFKRVHAM